jgi:hypothetical protein
MAEHASETTRSSDPDPAKTSRARTDPLATPASAVLALQRSAGNRATTAMIQREVQFRPPGRGEATAYDRRQELVDRLNRQSPGLVYWLREPDARRAILRYEVWDESLLNNFDRQMMGFIDRAEVVPMRLITRHGLVDGEALLIDSLQLAYVDVDDMMGSDDLSFEMNLIHFLTERFRVRNYERRIGTDMSADFPRAHAAGNQAEAEHLRSVIGDPTLQFNHEREENGRTIFVFRSRNPFRYEVVHVFGRSRRGLSTGTVFALRGNRRLTIPELIAERAAAAPAPAAGAAAAAPAGAAPVPAVP